MYIKYTLLTIIQMSCWWCKKKSNCDSVPVTSLPVATTCNGISTILINWVWYQYNPSNCSWGSPTSFTNGNFSGNVSIAWTLWVAWDTTLQDLIVNWTSEFNWNVDFEAWTTVDFTWVNVTWLTWTILSAWTNVTITWAWTLASPYVINASWWSTPTPANIATNVAWVTWVTAIKKWVSWAMNGTSLVVTDATSTTTSIINWTTQTNAVWFIEVIPWNGSFTINSTAVETWLVFNYVIIS